MNRFRILKDPEQSFLFTEFKSEYYAKCIRVELDAILNSKVSVKSDLSKNVPYVQTSNVPSVSKTVPVFKWIIFYGKNISLLSFFEHVEELKKARNVSDKD